MGLQLSLELTVTELKFAIFINSLLRTFQQLKWVEKN